MTDELTLSKSDATKGERTRADIVLAAHDLIIQNGYHGTSMRQIAKQAGIALGGIYNHFASKEDIFREVVLTYHPYHEIMPILANAQYDSIEELLCHAAHLIDDTLNTRPDVLNLMFIEMVEFRSKHIPDLLERVFPIVTQILQRFTEAGDNLRPIPMPMLMRTFISVLFGYFISKNALGENISLEFRENALDYFLDIYLHGILKSENPK
ncbi:MAG TPA: TetR/AcrR family transcriptional regulator [Anaerolineales bacterium]|nr:TetR/AcrR family transcriptional regulator [Anaerolineales bacterium]